jgi:hypothetical protein
LKISVINPVAKLGESISHDQQRMAEIVLNDIRAAYKNKIEMIIDEKQRGNMVVSGISVGDALSVINKIQERWPTHERYEEELRGGTVPPAGRDDTESFYIGGPHTGIKIIAERTGTNVKFTFKQKTNSTLDLDAHDHIKGLLNGKFVQTGEAKEITPERAGPGADYTLEYDAKDVKTGREIIEAVAKEASRLNTPDLVHAAATETQARADNDANPMTIAIAGATVVVKHISERFGARFEISCNASADGKEETQQAALKVIENTLRNYKYLRTVGREEGGPIIVSDQEWKLQELGAELRTLAEKFTTPEALATEAKGPDTEAQKDGGSPAVGATKQVKLAEIKIGGGHEDGTTITVERTGNRASFTIGASGESDPVAGAAMTVLRAFLARQTGFTIDKPTDNQHTLTVTFPEGQTQNIELLKLIEAFGIEAKNLNTTKKLSDAAKAAAGSAAKLTFVGPTATVGWDPAAMMHPEALQSLADQINSLPSEQRLDGPLREALRQLRDAADLALSRT